MSIENPKNLDEQIVEESAEEPEDEDGAESEKEELEFDREAEKEHRKAIKQALGRAVTEVLSSEGFKRDGMQWRRKVGGMWHGLWLDRSPTSHRYYIQIGIRAVDKDEKPPHILHFGGDRWQHNPKIRRDTKRIGTIDFEMEDIGREDFEDSYYPSITMEEAEKRIEEAQRIIQEEGLLWFESQSE